MSRCLLIEFSNPPLDVSVTDFEHLPELLKQSSSAIGAVISLRKRFLESGISEIGNILQPEVRKLLGGMAIPRVIVSYASLLWFTMQVRIIS